MSPAVTTLACGGTFAALLLAATPAAADPLDDAPPPVRKYVEIVVDSIDRADLQFLDDVYCAYYRDAETGDPQKLACVPAPDEMPIADEYLGDH